MDKINNSYLCSAICPGYSPLHYAAAWGHSEVLKLLVTAGANVQQKNVHGECPRDTAARYSKKECVNFLDWAG